MQTVILTVKMGSTSTTSLIMKDTIIHPLLEWPMTVSPYLEGMKKIMALWRDTVSRWTIMVDMTMVMILVTIIMHTPRR